MPVPQDESHSLHAPQSLSVQSITMNKTEKNKFIELLKYSAIYEEIFFTNQLRYFMITVNVGYLDVVLKPHTNAIYERISNTKILIFTNWQ